MPTPPFVTTPPEAFADLPEFPYAPNSLAWEGMGVAVVDEGPRDAPVALLLHGEPTWSYLYATMIPGLLADGYRCVAPDLIGFGRSDKVTDDAWYVIERHVETIRFVIETLDLRRVTLFVQDWAGPIGLRQAIDMPERFARVVIMNTWLHHDGYEYSDGIRAWRAAALNPDLLGGDMPTGRIVTRSMRRDGHDAARLTARFDAPFAFDDPQLRYAAKAGARRFPWCIPFGQPDEGNAADQQRAYDALCRWDHTPVHVIFGDADSVFTADWGRAWASRIPGATFDAIAGAGHFLQLDAGSDVLAAFRRRVQTSSG